MSTLNSRARNVVAQFTELPTDENRRVALVQLQDAINHDHVEEVATEAADRQKGFAERALVDLIDNAESALRQLRKDGTVSTSVGGSALNIQRFMDAERALTLYWQARDFQAWAER